MVTQDSEFNQLQEISIKQFNDLNIKIYGTYANPLFKANDIGNLLEIKKIRNTIDDFDKDEAYTMGISDSLGRLQQTNMLTERGLYKVLMISRKPIAKQFQDWVYDVIIEIRKTGEYKLQKKVENEIKSTTLIENYLNKSVVYIGTVKEMNLENETDESNESKIVKYGITRCVKDTLDRHRKTYGHQFYFNYMTECGYKDVVERRIQTHNDLVSRHVREYNGKKCNELLRLDQNFTINNLITIIKTLQESMESRYDREIELAREKTKQMQIESECEKTKLENELEREKTKQKELDIKLEIKRMEFELRKLELEKSTMTSINKYASIYEEFIDTCTSYSGNADDNYFLRKSNIKKIKNSNKHFLNNFIFFDITFF
jgi:prophage antirepressor-like protein